MRRTGMNAEEAADLSKHNYTLINDLARKIEDLKGYAVGYGNPRKGKMIINHNGMNYVVDVEPIGEGDLSDIMKEYDYIFRD